MIIVPRQASENISEFLTDFENTLADLNVPPWKVFLGGLFLVILFLGSFHFMLWVL